MNPNSNSAVQAHRIPPPLADFDAVKARQQATWASGDYARIGVTLQIVGEQLCEAVDLRAGERVLDVATGNGNASLAAARRFGQVVAIDYVDTLLDRGRARAAADALPIEWQVADAEDLPFDDDAFDVALSTFGVMFTPNPARAAQQLLRVTRPGGRIGLANWTPDGFIGQLLRTIARHVPPPAGQASPLRWGTEPGIVEWFGPAAADIRVARRHFMFRYASPEHWLTHFKSYYGPLLQAFAALPVAGQAALHADIAELLVQANRGIGTLLIPGEYLEVVIETS